MFFDNTGGPIHDAVLRNLAVAARVVICGRIALANNFDQEDIGLRASSRLIVTRATIQGLVVFDWWHRRDEALGRLAAWHRSGAIQTREDILEGFENVPRGLHAHDGRPEFRQAAGARLAGTPEWRYAGAISSPSWRRRRFPPSVSCRLRRRPRVARASMETASRRWSADRLVVAGLLTKAVTSWFSFVTISRGVFAWTNTPTQAANS